MALTREARSWNDLFAARTRAGVGAGLADILALAGDTTLIPFAGGFPDAQTFPAAAVSTLLAELVAAGDASALQYAPTQGLPGPRDVVSGRLDAYQGRRPADDEVMITSGTIEALELIGKSFLDAGDVVVVEGPTYLGAIMAFRSFEADVVAVPLDGEGLQVDELERRLAAGLRPKLLYAIPDYQNPAGLTLTEERRIELVELARRYGFLIVEDVAYRELGFGRDPPPSMWSLAPDVVVQAGTTSKTFFPGVRLGWAVGPATRRRPAGRREAEHRPVRGRAGPAPLRGVRPPRLDGRAARAFTRALPAALRTAAPRARAAHARRRHAGPGPKAGSSRG